MIGWYGRCLSLGGGARCVCTVAFGAVSERKFLSVHHQTTSTFLEFADPYFFCFSFFLDRPTVTPLIPYRPLFWFRVIGGSLTKPSFDGTWEVAGVVCGDDFRGDTEEGVGMFGMVGGGAEGGRYFCAEIDWRG